jgi:hypothetical protein
VNRDALTFIVALLVVFGGALFLVRPEPNTAQTVFRFALVVIGLAGLTLVHTRGRRR